MVCICENPMYFFWWFLLSLFVAAYVLRRFLFLLWIKYIFLKPKTDLDTPIPFDFDFDEHAFGEQQSVHKKDEHPQADGRGRAPAGGSKSVHL